MKKRVIAAAVMIIALLVLVLAAPKWIGAVVFGLLMSVSAYELLYRTGLVHHLRLVLYSMIAAFLVTMWSYFGAVHAYLVLIVLLFVFAMFGEMMNDHVKVRFSMIGECFLAGIVVPYLLGAVVRILTMRMGRYFALIPFVVGCINDGGAYFVGLRYGKHKLAPVVSPNKTIEGLVGGIGAAMVGMLIYGVILQIADFRVNYGLALLYGLLGSAVGVFGDLCFSIIKRQTGIKDYGDLIPGHGGVLDRLDSLMTVAPLIEVLLILLPVAVD